jgi:hypothetical protein
MQALSPPNIESELSYAYLHAVASKAGMACRESNRHEDNNGIDAMLTAWGPFPNGGYLTEVDIKVQLKATFASPSDDGANLGYFLKEVNRYNDLRAETVDIARILVVLFLPEDPNTWLHHTTEQLALRRCAYWQSLGGAPETTNKTGVTVKLPKVQVFTPGALQSIVARLSRRDFPRYPGQ